MSSSTHSLDKRPQDELPLPYGPMRDFQPSSTLDSPSPLLIALFSDPDALFSIKREVEVDEPGTVHKRLDSAEVVLDPFQVEQEGERG